MFRAKQILQPNRKLKYKKPPSSCYCNKMTAASICLNFKSDLRPYLSNSGFQAAATALMRAERRESLRETELAFSTPLPAARCSSGCMSRNAVWAASLFPAATASSTLRMKLCTRDLRALLRAVRFSVWRMRFWADAILAMISEQKKMCNGARRLNR